MIWFSSDHHWFHKNIIEYSKRPFGTIAEMNDTMIQKWNSVVDKKDYVYYCGDFALAGKEKIKELREKLNGIIYLVVGNHDRTKKSMAECGFEILTDLPRKDDHYLLLQPLQGMALEPLVLTHSPYYEQRIALMEKYGYEFNSWNIHGHVHFPHAKKIDAVKRQINVNVELWDFRPVSLEEIYQLIFDNNYVDYRIS